MGIEAALAFYKNEASCIVLRGFPQEASPTF